MDNQEFSWTATLKATSLIKDAQIHLPYSMALAIPSGILIYSIIFSQFLVPLPQVVTILLAMILTIFCVISLLWHMFNPSHQNQVRNYLLTPKSLNLNHSKQIPLASLHTPSIVTILEQSSLPFSQWTKVSPISGQALKLDLPTNTENITLLFADEYTRQKFVHTLTEYLNIV